jgi:two-component system cell cycle response regulator CtrA
MRVLLVEDGSAIAKATELLLLSEGCTCDCTDFGEDGQERDRLQDYDLIVLDLILPNIDGYEVLRRLRAARVDIPILILSGLSELDRKTEGLNVSAGDYAIKPFDKAELADRIQTIVHRSRLDAEAMIAPGKRPTGPEPRAREAAGHPAHRAAKEYGMLEYGVLLALVMSGVIIAADFLIAVARYGGGWAG